jgi:hypothetical protein
VIFILPRANGGGGPAEGRWKGRVTQRFAFVERVSSQPAPRPPRSARSPLPAIAQGCPGKNSTSRIKALRQAALTLVASCRDLTKCEAIKLSLLNRLNLFPGQPCAIAGRDRTRVEAAE